jgi:hypothetical protein
VDAFVACFHPEYRSEQPLHPDRAFLGTQQVRTNWAEVFAGVPDFHADLVRSAREDDTGAQRRCRDRSFDLCVWCRCVSGSYRLAAASSPSFVGC